MKKYGIIVALIAAIVVGIGGWWLLRGSNDNAASSLPANVTMVGRVDFKSLALGYGLSWDEVKELIASKNDKEDTGIDFSSNAYLFASQGYFGAIVPLGDADDFEAFLRREGETIETQRGLKWSVLNGNMLLAFSDDRAMFMGPALGAELDNLRNTLATCIRQKETESGKQSRLYKLATEREEPIGLATNFTTLPEVKLLREIPWLKVKLPLDALNLSAGVTLKKERFSLSAALDTEDKKTEKMLNRADDIFSKVNGDLLATTPANPLFHMMIGLDGEDLLTLLRENDAIRTALLMANALIDLDMIVKSIDGDVSLTLMGDSQHPDLLFQAQLENDKFMRNVTSWNDDMTRMAGLQFYARDEHNAICRMKSGTDFYFSTADKRLRISNNEATATATAHNDVAWAIKDDARKNILYATLDLSSARSVGPVSTSRLSTYFSRVTLSAPDLWHLDLNFDIAEGVDLLKEFKKE